MRRLMQFCVSDFTKIWVIQVNVKNVIICDRKDRSTHLIDGVTWYSLCHDFCTVCFSETSILIQFGVNVEKKKKRLIAK